MKSTWFGDRRRYDFARCLEAAHPGAHIWDMFPAWASCCSIAIRQAVNRLVGEFDQGLEDRYLLDIGRCKDASKFPEAMAILAGSLEDSPGDFIGKTLGESGCLNKWAGQFFTPDSVSRCMAEMSLGDARPVDGRKMTICEPACGSGAMAIQTAMVLRDRGFQPWHYHMVCVDLDVRMFQSAYIQLSLLGIPACVVNANTLTLEQFDEATTLVGAMHPMRSIDAAKRDGIEQAGKIQKELF